MQSDPSKYFHNVVGTRSYTTSTTNMYHKDRFHVPSCEEGSSGASSDTGHLHTLGLALLQINPIGKKKRDRIGHVSHTYKRKIDSTPHVIQPCICIIRSILQVTQRVPPTCTIIQISRTAAATPPVLATFPVNVHYRGIPQNDVVVRGEIHRPSPVSTSNGVTAFNDFVRVA